MKRNFSITVKFQGKKYGRHNMTALYPNPCYNEVCNKGIALQFSF